MSRAPFRAAGACLLLAAAACPSPPPSAPPAPTPNTTASATATATPVEPSTPLLHQPLESYDFEGHADLLERIVDSPFQYMRFTSRGFAARVCELFSDVLPALPTVNLHGDAHLEQFAVTNTGHGLVDFDDATAGPAVIDLVRFGVSLRLAAEANGWDPDEAIDHLFAGYRTALHHPKATEPLPDFVERARERFSDDRLAFLARSEAMMGPVLPKEKAQLLAAWARYVELMLSQDPSRGARFFALKRFGHVRGGVGSALDKRILARVEGPTDAPEDDVILEAKELRDMSQVSCVKAEPIGGHFRTIVGRARLGDGEDPFLALIPRGSGDSPEDAPFWVQSWLPDYRELDVETDLQQADELEQIAFHVGIQLGRGHVLHIATPFDDQLRRAELDMLRDGEPRIRRAIDRMTETTLASWEAFKEAVRSRPPR